MLNGLLGSLKPMPTKILPFMLNIQKCLLSPLLRRPRRVAGTRGSELCHPVQYGDATIRSLDLEKL